MIELISSNKSSLSKSGQPGKSRRNESLNAEKSEMLKCEIQT